MAPHRRRYLGVVVALLAAAAALALFARSRSQRATRRVLVIGLDGADWQLLDAYRAAGAMPELDRLAREGRSGVLRSLVPPLSPLVWTTIATGVSPLQQRVSCSFEFLGCGLQPHPQWSGADEVKSSVLIPVEYSPDHPWGLWYNQRRSWLTSPLKNSTRSSRCSC